MTRRYVATGKTEVLPLLLETHSTLVEAIERELESIGGLQLSWYDVLAQLSLAPEHHLKMNELADSVLLSKSGITRLVDRMERAGLIERGPCPTDRRVVYALLTPAGEQLFRRAKPVIEYAVQKHLIDHLDDAEVDAVKTALQKIVAGCVVPEATSHAAV